MKYPKEQYRILLKAFIAVIKRQGYTIEEVRESYQFRCNPMKLGWDLFRLANAGLNGCGNHCDAVKSYATYPHGIDDTHIKTAIKNILKDLDLWWEQGGEA